MTQLVEKLVTFDSFDDTMTLRKKGELGYFKPENLKNSAGEENRHLADVDGFETAVVQIAPIAPTGPNPTAPQQIPPDARQGPGGGYVMPGKVLVGEVTLPGEDRAAQVEGADEDKVSKALEKALGSAVGNDDDALVDGTVAEVTADLGAKSDEELDALEAAEKDREAPRKGVLNAIKAERAKRG